MPRGRNPYVTFGSLIDRVHERPEYSPVSPRYFRDFCVEVLNEMVKDLKEHKEIFIPYFGRFRIELNTKTRITKPNAGKYRLRFYQNVHLQETIKNVERSNPDDCVPLLSKSQTDEIVFGIWSQKRHQGYNHKPGPGRPRKKPANPDEPPKPKRKRGRPRKDQSAV